MHVRSLFAVAVAALLVGPATVHAQAKKSSSTKAAPAKAAPAPTAAVQTNSIGGWIGYEMGDLDGLQLRGEYVMPYQKLSPQVALSFVGAIGYSYLTTSTATPFGDADTTANVLKFVPAARFSMPVAPQFTLFGDAGLGLYWASVNVKTPAGFGLGTTSASSSDVGFMLRFGVGGFYKLNPKMQIGASLYLDPMFGGYEDNTFTILAGLAYAL